MKLEKKIRSIPYAAMELHTQIRDGIPDPQVFWDTARFLFGNENLMAWRAMGGNNKIEEMLDKNDIVFRTAETTGAGFVQRLCELSLAGVFTGKSGKNLLESSANYKLLLNPLAIPLVLKKMGISAPVFMQCVTSIKRNADNDSGKPGDVNV